MQLTAEIDHRVLRHHDPRPHREFASSCPPTPAEAATASVGWERRGPLRRLVRVDLPLAPS